MRRAMCLIVVAFVLSGCATVTRGLSNQVQINSSPPGAEARTSMGHQCVTPCTLQFQRRDEFSVVISKAGFHSEEVAVQTRLAGAGAAGFVGNVVVGGVVGMAVDAASGATLEHCPNPVTITLQPANRPRARVDHAAACRVAPTEPSDGQEARCAANSIAAATAVRVGRTSMKNVLPKRCDVGSPPRRSQATA